MKLLFLILFVIPLIGCSNGQYVGPKASVTVAGYGASVTVSAYATPTPAPIVVVQPSPK